MNKESINIAFGVDINYLKRVGTLIHSIVVNNKNYNINCYVLCSKTDENTINQLNKLEQYHENLNIKIINVTKGSIYNIPYKGEGHLPIEAYFRILLPDLLPRLNKILYLDTDLIVNKSLSEMWHTNIENVSIAGVRENDMYELDKENLDLINFTDEDNYFNSGVLLMNLNLMRERNITNKLIEIAINDGLKLKHNDQDLLNIHFKNDKVVLDKKFNYTPWWMRNEVDTDHFAIAHFCAPWTKPWNKLIFLADYVKPYAKIYRQYRKQYYDIVNSNTKKVTIILFGNHNENYLEECLDSIWNQTYSNIEVFLYCKKNSKQYTIFDHFSSLDDRIKIYTEEDFSEKEFIEQAIKESSGDYVTCVNSSNFLEENYVFDFINNVKESNNDIYLNNYYVYNENIGQFIYYDVFSVEKEELVSYENIKSKYNSSNNKLYLNSIWGKFFSKTFFKSISKNISDEFINLSIYENATVKYINKNNYCYRITRNKLVSVIINGFANNYHIEECLNSVLNQSYHNLEILIVIDKSSELLENYKNNDNRISIIETNNTDISHNRNMGINKSKGEYLIFVDSEDIMDLNQITELCYYANITNSDIVQGQYYEFNENDNVFYYFNLDESKECSVISSIEALKIQDSDNYNYLTSSNKLLKRELINQLSFPENNVFYDEYITHQLYLNAKKIVYVNKNLYIYRKSGRRHHLDQINNFIIAYDKKITDYLLVDIDTTNTILRYKNMLNKYKVLLEQNKKMDTKNYFYINNKLRLFK